MGIAATLTTPAARAKSHGIGAKVAVVGGGFGGATLARRLKQLAPDIEVSLIEKNETYTACPLSNLVLSGQRNISQQQFSLAGLTQQGINIIHDEATEIDTTNRQISLRSGATLNYDKVVVAPGIRLLWQAIEGYTEAASAQMPHAWQAGSQTLLLRRQLMAMPANGTVVMAIPENPYRCPPGPYERASLIANYLSQHKPRAKLLLLDAKDNFSKQALFQQGWQSLYGNRIEWRGLADSGKVIAVDPTKRMVQTDFDSEHADVANIIPPQAAAGIAASAGLTDASGWCPIDPLTFASTLVNDAYVIGDAAIANAMPKSAFAANAQAKVCAAQIVQELNGEPPLSTTLINTCYSLIAPDYGISVAGVYRAGPKGLESQAGTGGTSSPDASARTRALEARYAQSWFTTVTREAFASEESP